MLALVLALPGPASAATITDMAQNFDGQDVGAWSGTSTTQNGHTGQWLSGYGTDAWAGRVPIGGREVVRTLRDDSGGTWGGAGEAIDDHLTYTGREWRDFTLTTRTYINGDDGVGLVFRWQNSSNFYLVVMTRDDGPNTGTGGNTVFAGSRLYKVVNGSATQLASSTTVHTNNTWQRLRVIAAGSSISVAFDSNDDGDYSDGGEALFSVTDTSISTVGRVGLYAYNASDESASFDDLTVTIDDKDSDGDAIPDARDICVGSKSQVDVDGNRVGDDCQDNDADGQTEVGGDCNDTNKLIFTGATETCDAVDSDCDGDLVDGALDTDKDKSPDCVDADDDGDGVADGSDCKSLDKTIYPGATELCDAIDSDCDLDLVDGFTDTDADKTPDCTDTDDDGDGTVDGSDCAPLDKAIRPGASEVCDGVDSDCDGDYVDGFTNNDADKYADCFDTDDDNDTVADTGDCRPLDKTIYPGATEVCDLIDQDCDGNVIEAFPNFDGDTEPDCVDTDDDNDGSLDTPDCNDFDKTVFPGAVESPCDAIDSDCDGLVNDGVAGDFDTDGTPDCTDLDDDNDTDPDLTDCNDFDKNISTKASEVCDAIDSNCNGDLVDTFTDTDKDKNPDCVDLDDDGDGNVDTADCAPLDKTIFVGAVEACDAIDSNCNTSLVDGFADFDVDLTPDCTDPDDDGDGNLDAADCAPFDKTVFVGQTEACDLIDSNCNGNLVDGAANNDADLLPDCVDPDDDEDGEPDTVDCQPLDKLVNHAATETCNATDDDCNGTVDDAYATDASTWYFDADQDGEGDATREIDACTRPVDYVKLAGDCDDARAAAHHGATETCARGDEDCNGFADDREPDGPPADAESWFVDGDSDTFGDPANPLIACVQPDGTSDAFSAQDCDDTNTDVNPIAVEVCNNGFDDDCDNIVDDDAGNVPWWPDADGDGFGDALQVPTEDCAPPGLGWVTNGDDCDDADPEVFPGVGETPGNGVDDDCDPETPDEVDTGDTGETDDTAVDTDTAVASDSDRPWVAPLDTGVLPVPGEACGCAHGGTSGAAFAAAVLAFVMRRRRGSVVRGARSA